MFSDPEFILKPSGLVSGDTIGIVAPSSPFDNQKFFNGISVIEEMGLRVFFPEKIFEQKGYLAGSDTHRAELFNTMFANPLIKGIICARGGYGSLRMLPLLNFNTIASNPKILIGCSDITILLNTLFLRCRLVSLHGPMVESLGNATDQTKQSLQDMLFKNQLRCLRPEKQHSDSPRSSVRCSCRRKPDHALSSAGNAL
jgi:muramoyltetrapeptide carboxypeptidase